MHNNCPSEKIEIKRKIFGYQLKIAGEYNILIGNIANSFDKKKCVLHYENLQLQC